MIFLLLQEDLGRIFIIFVPQQLISIVFIILAYRVLKRQRTRPTITLSLWYICTGAGLIFNAVFILIADLFFGNIILIISLYFISFYLLLFSNIFLLTFTIAISRLESQFSLRRHTLYILVFAILSAVIMLLPEGITLDPENNWRPTFSWYFFILMFIVFTGIITVPTVYYIIKLYALFEAKNLKKKLRYFMIGVFGMLLTIYGAALFNTWEFTIYRTVWSVVTVIIIVPSAFFIYYGIGPKL